MDELAPVLPPELDLALTEFYTFPRPDPAFAARLEAHLRRQQIQLNSPGPKSAASFSETRKSFMHILRTRPVVALMMVILALLAMTGIVYALGRLTGFIPGFGFTSNTGTVSVLSEPIEMNRGGVTLRLDNAVSDDARFWVALTVKGLNSSRETNIQVFVLLPDGKKVQMQVGGLASSPHGETQISSTIPALPSGTQSLTILIENLEGQNYALALRLRPVKPGEIIPVHPTENAQPQSTSQNGVSLVLDNVAPTSDKTIFQVSLKNVRPNTGVSGPWNIRLSDQAGRAYPVKDITPATIDMGKTRIFQTSPFTGAERLTLSLGVFPNPEELPMFEDFSAQKSGFTFDPGTNPQPGQTWALNETVEVGQFKLHIVRATVTTAVTNGPGLEFEFEKVENVTGVMLYTSDPLVRGATGGVPVKDKNFTTQITFEKIPMEPFKVVISQVHYTVKGLWQIQWQPPQAPTAEAGFSTPVPTQTKSPTVTPTLPASDPILLEVQQLAQKFDAPFQQGPGWVHVVRESHNAVRDGQTFPPAYLKTEQWYEIDADGYITRSVWMDFNDAGLSLQQSATIGNYTVNFTTGDSGLNNGTRYRISLDMLGMDPNSPALYPMRITREQTTCDNGNPCLLITGQESFKEPVKLGGENQAFSGSGRRVWIDTQSGQQVKFQSFWQLQDGSQSITTTQITLLVEKLAAPPQEILDLLARVVVPK